MALVADNKPQVRRPMQVLSLGLPRTGTSSIAEALTILGYQDVHHGYRCVQSQWIGDYSLLSRAADLCFPFLPTYKGGNPETGSSSSMTRKDWDEIFGPCEAVTDIASVFGAELVAAYPEAKVVLVGREFDSWYRSVDEAVVQVFWSPGFEFLHGWVEPWLGTEFVGGARKIVLGIFRVGSREEINREVARRAYEEHYEGVRRAVKAGSMASAMTRKVRVLKEKREKKESKKKMGMKKKVKKNAVEEADAEAGEGESKEEGEGEKVEKEEDQDEKEEEEEEEEEDEEDDDEDEVELEDEEEEDDDYEDDYEDEGRLLEFKLEDGWEPLCEFLGKPLPAGWEWNELPRTNDAEVMKKAMRDLQTKMLGSLLVKAMPGLVAMFTVGTAFFAWRRR